MDRPGLRMVCCVVLAMSAGVDAQQARIRPPDLPKLAASLELTRPGIRRWLNRLAASTDASVESLLAVSLTGDVLLERVGAGSSVPIDPEMDALLRRSDSAIVLIHNHPANVGLSARDLEHVGKPGVEAIIALGHNGSAFVAAAGPHLDPLWFKERQYDVASAELRKRLRAELPSSRVPVDVSDTHFSHLVTLVLARAGVVHYWFRLEGAGRESFNNARLFFGRVVNGASGELQTGEWKRAPRP
jgi:hypothetical protein